jgi:hypothetical protein
LPTLAGAALIVSSVYVALRTENRIASQAQDDALRQTKSTVGYLD